MTGGGDRPCFQHSISQLEALFEQATSDREALHVLHHELSFRETVRATSLRKKVSAALATESLPGATVAPGPVLDSLPTPSAPESSNEPTAILAAWTALEALSPQTYKRPEDLCAGDRRCVADLSNGHLPWSIGESSRPKKQLYYQVILGAIPMDRATDELVNAFGEDEERNSRAREKAAIAAVLINRNGILVEENGVAVSSFAWALPLALELNFRALQAWPGVERNILEGLSSILRRFNDDGQPVPLDMGTIESAHRWLVAQLRLPAQLVEPPAFALRVYHYFKAKNPPEVSLLNSFFLGDLATAIALVEKNAAPAALRQYLSIDPPNETFDLLSDKVSLEKAVAPQMTPAARWPGPGGHPLVMLQQAAVNLARAELAGGEGMLAVNGPPSTGKTTLLRDIVAACVLDRALAMAAFEDPEKAFSPSGEKTAAGEKAFFHLYALAPSLKGHEILVASSNNKAVENVSRELPATKAVGRTTEELSYFKSVSDLVHEARDSTDANDEGDEGPTNTVETWGLIAAVLGNAKNRAAFQQSFWWHEDRGFRLYLKAAKGDSVVREIKDPQSGKVIERRTPSVVLIERPPSPENVRTNWLRSRARLLALKREIETELEVLEEVRQLCRQLVETERRIPEREAALALLLAQRPQREASKMSCHRKRNTATQEHEQRSADVQHHLKSRPGFFARLFRTQRAMGWSIARTTLAKAQSAAAETLHNTERSLREATAELESLTADIRNAEELLTCLRQELEQLSRQVAEQRRVLGRRLVDEQFFGRGHEASNLEAPWIPDSLHRKREDLFVAALGAHKAFIDASAQKVLHNLSVLMDVFSNGPPQDDAKRSLLGDLWATLCLVVPVISTTFASVERMLGDLPPGSIGWLLIDEAGQALPQAAVGAIMRARRAIVVGDPLQIPPVVTLPERLNSEICRFFRIDEPVWAAPKASAQALADRASRFQAAFRSDRGQRRVGVPLLVHRRCQEPMFGISNCIAYDSQMVYASGPRRDGALGTVLGPSAWLDIDGDADSKWCPAEGDLVVSLLSKIAESGITHPDLFIITPFRIVAHELRRRLERESSLFSALRINRHEWASDRIGTIHTVQGREADSVILVLGAPKSSQNRARSWAADTPNIINVAVSRAKQTLYVVGSRGAWSGVGYARELALSMPHTRV